MKQILILIFLLTFTVNAQQNEGRRIATFKLKELALLNIVPNSSSVMLSLNSPNSSGEKVNTTSNNNSKWINFTSAIAKNSSPRDLSIRIEDGTVPAGIHLKLNVESYSGNGKGALGTKAGTITLNNNLQTIVSNIGGAFTGYGVNNGYKLTYFLEIYDYKLLNIDNSEILSISLTLTDF